MLEGINAVGIDVVRTSAKGAHKRKISTRGPIAHIWRSHRRPQKNGTLVDHCFLAVPPVKNCYFLHRKSATDVARGMLWNPQRDWVARRLRVRQAQPRIRCHIYRHDMITLGFESARVRVGLVSRLSSIILSLIFLFSTGCD